MRPPLEVRTASHYWKRIVLLYVFLGPFAGMGIVQGAHDLQRHGWAQWDKLLMVLGVVVVLLAAPCALLVSRRRWVARFDEHGVTLRNGRRFSWEGFLNVEERRSHNGRFVNNYDLVFRDGTAGVYHHMAANDAEVLAALAALKRGENPFRPLPPQGAYRS